MKYDKLLAGGNLDNIMCRLNSCLAILRVVHSDLAADENSDTVDALYGACDMLRAILQDFQADVDAAEDVPDKIAAEIRAAAKEATA